MNNEEHLITRWASVLYRHRRCFMSKKLESLGSAGGMFMILLTVGRFDGISQEKISDYLKIDKTTTAKAIKKLESDGYVHRAEDPEDRRVNRVFLTPKAEGAMPEIRGALAEWDRSIRAGITEEEYRNAEETLHRMAENACREAGSPGRPPAGGPENRGS